MRACNALGNGLGNGLGNKAGNDAGLGFDFAIEEVDEIFIGPVFADEAGRHLGFERLKTLLTLLEMQGIDMPVWIFGGVTPEHIPQLETLPVTGISTSSFIVSVEDIVANMKLFMA